MFKYLFRVSAIVDNSFIVEADSYNKAREERAKVIETIKDQLMKAVNGKTASGWNYDGNVNDEGEENVGENNTYTIKTQYCRRIKASSRDEAEHIAMSELERMSGLGGKWVWCEDANCVSQDEVNRKEAR